MRKRLLAGASAAAVGAASAVTALVIGTTTGWAADTTSSAWGASATGQLPFSPTPYIESTDGSTQKSSSAKLPDQVSKYLNVSAIDLMAGNDKASSSVGQVSVPGSAVPKALQDQIDNFTKQLTDACDQAAQASQGLTLDTLKDALPKELAPVTDNLPDGVGLQTLCDAAKKGDGLLGLKGTTVSCNGDKGTMDLGDVTLFGQKLSLPAGIPKKNQTIIDIPQVLTVTANKQVKNDDGSFSITGLSIDLAGKEKINLLGATCGKPQSKVEPTSSKKSAPKPAPVTTDLPVTG